MDKKAIKILLKTIKTSQIESLGNWYEWDTYKKYITEEDFNYAKKHSVMYDPIKIGHNEICRRIKIAVEKIEKQKVVDSFLYSLSTRKLEYRSFLSSYCIGKSLAEHNFIPSLKPNEKICKICGLYTHEFEKLIEFNTLNYFKYKDGSCTDNLIGVLFDLEQFSKLPIVKPTQNDFDILNKIKETIETAETNDRISKLNKNISKIIKSNAEERLGLLEIFGIIGILHDDKHFGYFEKYATYTEREHRPIRYDDVGYPSRWWKGEFGIDNKKWNYWFVKK